MTRFQWGDPQSSPAASGTEGLNRLFPAGSRAATLSWPRCRRSSRERGAHSHHRGLARRSDRGPGRSAAPSGSGPPVGSWAWALGRTIGVGSAGGSVTVAHALTGGLWWGTTPRPARGPDRARSGTSPVILWSRATASPVASVSSVQVWWGTTTHRPADRPGGQPRCRCVMVRPRSARSTVQACRRGMTRSTQRSSDAGAA
jgi:hypothetical protein